MTDPETPRRRLWLEPLPGWGVRAVAIKRRIGWRIVYRERGIVRQMLALRLPQH